jgi:predicted dienelactone hydrolase
MHAGVRKLMLIVLVLLSAVLLTAQTGGAGAKLPAPTGPYAVSRMTFDWKEPASKQTSARELRVDLWYPAERTSARLPEYVPPEVLRNHAAGEEMAAYYRDAWQSVSTGSVASYATANGKPARNAGAFPVLIFIPGAGMSVFAYTAQVVDLATHGYAVATVQSPGDVSVVFPDGHAVAPNEVAAHAAPESDEELQQARRDTDVLAADAIFVLKRLRALAEEKPMPLPPFYHLLDLTRVGVFGHSSGGRAAIRACQLDAAIHACANQDGTFYWKPWLTFEGATLRHPVMVLDHRDPELPDQAFAAMHTTRAAYEHHRSEQQKMGKTMYASARHGAYHVTITTEGVNHGSFTDLRLLQAKSPEQSAQAEGAMALIRLYTRAFFDRVLRQASAPVLTRPEPGVVIDDVNVNAPRTAGGRY